jgi:hypothetical protein
MRHLETVTLGALGERRLTHLHVWRSALIAFCLAGFSFGDCHLYLPLSILCAGHPVSGTFNRFRLVFSVMRIVRNA